MLQRGFSDTTDPARGRLEFPGGHVDPGETPLVSAKREFGEETGIVPPTGKVFNTWRSGPYRGFVIRVPREKDIKINLPREKRRRVNPDDPDGDEVETVLWVDRESLKSNPMVRSELKQAMRLVLAALSSEITPDKKYAFYAEGREMVSGKVAALQINVVTRELVLKRAASIAESRSGRTLA